MSSSIPDAEILELLRRVGRGEVKPRLLEDDRAAPDCGCEAVFDVDGWRVRVGFDCEGYEINTFYYVESAISPDGRRWTLEGSTPPRPDMALNNESQELYERVAAEFEAPGDPRFKDE